MAHQIPGNLKYTEEHEWALLENGVVSIGITDFAQSSLGDIVFVELPEVGSNLDKGSTFGVVESIKSVSDLYSPVSGEVSEINIDLENSPENCNADPYGAWMVKIKIDSEDEYNALMSSSEYEAFCKNLN